MKDRSTDLVSLFEKSLRDVPQESLEEIGIVVQVGDGICTIHGLKNAIYGELIDFEGGNKGLFLVLMKIPSRYFFYMQSFPLQSLKW